MPDGSLCNVVLLNDDETPAEFVVTVLQDFLGALTKPTGSCFASTAKVRGSAASMNARRLKEGYPTFWRLRSSMAIRSSASLNRQTDVGHCLRSGLPIARA